MHVLFIGGTGLISTAITTQLLDAGHEVTLFNRGKTASRIPDGANVIHGDRKDYAGFEQTFSDKSYDVAVDMVAFQPGDTASAMRAFSGRVGQFIHCSTVCVYSGPVQQIPTTETEPFHSIGGYGKNKIACEKLLMDAFETDGFPMTIMRPSHSYGEGGAIIRAWGSHDTTVQRLRAGKPMIVPGDGQGLWASCHVDDVARGFIGVMQNEKALGQAYNITGDEWMTWDEYHNQVAEVVGGKFVPVHIPTDVLKEVAPGLSGGAAEIFAYPSIFSNDKIKRDTDYDGQKISFKEGNKRALAWLEENGKLAETNADAEAYEDKLTAAYADGAKSLPRQSQEKQ